MGTVTINVFTDGLTGHANVTFTGPNAQFEIGAQIAKFGIGVVTGSYGPIDGRIQIEDSRHRPGVSVDLNLPSNQFASVRDWAVEQLGPNNYGLFTCNCEDFVQQVYSKAGYKGGFGALFSVEDVQKNPAFVWSHIPDAPEFVIGLQQWKVVDPVTGKISYVDAPLYAPECFLAGTPVSMWPLDVKPDTNGKYNQQEVLAKIWKKPIEEVTPEDRVVSYDDRGLLIPGRVTRTFENHSKHILDVPVPQFNEQGKPDGTFTSLMVTPGHVTYCAPVEGEENRFAGKHVPIMDILRSDGALKMQDGTLIRAATGAVIGSRDDKQFWAHIFARAPDGSTKEREKKLLRLGTRWMLPDGKSITMCEHMDSIGVELIEEGKFKGYTCLKGLGALTGFEWRFSASLPKPEDYVLQRSALTLEAIYEADEWEAVRPQMPTPVAGEAGRSFKRDYTLYAGGAAAANDHLPPNIPHSMRNSPSQPTVNRQQRRALERKQQKANRAKKRATATVH